MNRVSRLSRDLLRTGAHIDPTTGTKYPWWDRGRSLRKYQGRQDVFGSFTSIFKLGINPQSIYKTPIGVYCYPLDYIIHKTVGDEFGVEFQGGAPYLHVFSVSGLEMTLKFTHGDKTLVNTFKDLDSDLDDHTEVYEDVQYWQSVVREIKDYINQTRHEIPEHACYQFRGKELSDYREWYDKWRKNLESKIGFKFDLDNPIHYIILKYGCLNIDYVWLLHLVGVFDEDTILRQISELIVLIHKSKMLIFPYEDHIRNLSVVSSMTQDQYYNMKQEVLTPPQRVVCDQAFAWNATRHLSGFNASKWTGLLRQLGLIGAVDYGTGTIHPNEPTQAVFFDMRTIKVLEVIDNKKSKQHQGEWNDFLSRSSYDPAYDSIEVMKSVLNEIEDTFDYFDSGMYKRKKVERIIDSSLRNIWKLVGWFRTHPEAREVWDQNRDVIIRTLRNTLVEYQKQGMAQGDGMDYSEQPIDWGPILNRLLRVVQRT